MQRIATDFQAYAPNEVLVTLYLSVTAQPGMGQAEIEDIFILIVEEPFLFSKLFHNNLGVCSCVHWEVDRFHVRIDNNNKLYYYSGMVVWKVFWREILSRTHQENWKGERKEEGYFIHLQTFDGDTG